MPLSSVYSSYNFKQLSPYHSRILNRPHLKMETATSADESGVEKPQDSPRPSKLQDMYALVKNGEKPQKVVMEWENIEYTIRLKDSKTSKPFFPAYQKKVILNNVSGRAESGQLFAIMGPTGCGKTSLLNVLAARVPDGGSSNIKLTGQAFINGVPRNDDSFRRISAYVLQDDKLYAHLTVKETLLLSAHFYLPTSTPLEQKELVVSNVIQELGLVKCTNTKIGDEKVRGISGGERKRANIGTQLIINPTVLFLDEPTTGLDSFQALAVMDSMKSMATNGRLVVSVIHQPRSSIYNSFDQLLLLSCGNSMYLGPVDGAVEYFSVCGFPCPKEFSPSDYFLDVLSPDNRNPQAETSSQQRIDLLGAKWVEHVASQKKIDRLELEPVAIPMMDYSWARIAMNFKLLCWRTGTEQLRQLPVLGIKLAITTFFSLIIGGIYSKSGYTQKSIFNRTGLLFIVCINQGFNNVIGVLNTFPKEKVIVNRERNANAYDTFSYFIAKYAIEMPLNTVPSIWFSCIVYWMVGLNPHRFGYFILILMLEAITCISLGLAISAFMPTIEASLAFGPPMVIIALLFGGFYINISSLPIVANWIPYMSFLKWAFEALCINEFTGEHFTCKYDANGTPIGSCIKTGEQVLTALSFADETINDACFGLGMVCLGFTVSALVFLHRSKGSFLNLGHVGINRMTSDQ